MERTTRGGRLAKESVEKLGMALAEWVSVALQQRLLNVDRAAHPHQAPHPLLDDPFEDTAAVHVIARLAAHHNIEAVDRARGDA
jgi:hypothetical protein